MGKKQISYLDPIIYFPHFWKFSLHWFLVIFLYHLISWYMRIGRARKYSATYRVMGWIFDMASQQGVDSLLIQCRASVLDAGPTLKQHWSTSRDSWCVISGENSIQSKSGALGEACQQNPLAQLKGVDFFSADAISRTCSSPPISLRGAGSDESLELWIASPHTLMIQPAGLRRYLRSPHPRQTPSRWSIFLAPLHVTPIAPVFWLNRSNPQKAHIPLDLWILQSSTLAERGGGAGAVVKAASLESLEVSKKQNASSSLTRKYSI